MNNTTTPALTDEYFIRINHFHHFSHLLYDLSGVFLNFANIL